MVRGFLATWFVDFWQRGSWLFWQRGSWIFGNVVRGFFFSNVVHGFLTTWACNYLASLCPTCWSTPLRFMGTELDVRLLDVVERMEPTVCVVWWCCVQFSLGIMMVGPCGPNHGPSNLRLTGTIGVSLSWWHISKYIHSTCSVDCNYDEFIILNKTSKSL